MNKLSCLAVVLAIAGVMGPDAQGAELEGALQYPPPSIGKDAQPPAPAGMVRQPMSPRRIELGVSGSKHGTRHPEILHCALDPLRRTRRANPSKRKRRRMSPWEVSASFDSHPRLA